MAVTLWLAAIMPATAQINTDRMLAIGRNALYFEDYVLSIQYFNQVIRSKPWLAEPYFYRAAAKISLDDWQGAEEDCSACLERNPFFVRAYYARGIARQSLERYDEAIADYRQGLEYRPEDRQMLVNMAVACIRKKDYDGAAAAFEVLMAAHPRHAMNYLARGAMFLERGDTAAALADYGHSIELDPYYAPAYGNRAIVRYRLDDFDGALADINEAIHLDTRQPGYYINRGLVRYRMNDLRGAMADYDQILSMDARNPIARFNRGLLRFQVGDNNRAIDDFDAVIRQEPDNFMAVYNRALLRHETGDAAGAIDDFDAVLARYPDFVPGYYSRAEARRQAGDLAGADRDVFLAYEKKEEQRRKAPPAADSSEIHTRERSDNNIGKFNRLVVYDSEEERRSKYQSEIRGRVQDRNVSVNPETPFILTYYEKAEPLRKSVYYHDSLDAFNAHSVLPMRLILTNSEVALNEEQIAVHFASIDRFSALIEHSPHEAAYYFACALDRMLVRDFDEALRNYDRAIDLDPDFALAYFNRAAVRTKQMDYARSQSAPDNNAAFNAAAAADPSGYAYEHELIVRDYDHVLRILPDFAFAFFNRANLRLARRDYRAAIADYSAAIDCSPTLSEAYFNRGLARLAQGELSRGIADLSKAGELGLVNAYSIIRRMKKD
jgi:tetratricopeptide (TPR) repeat protein